MTQPPPINKDQAPGTDAAESEGLLSCQPGRRGRPSVAEAEQLYGKILEASWQVLLDTGLETFTFDRVARHAHIGKATIYSRFAGKRELLEALVQHGIWKRRAAISAIDSSRSLAETFRTRAVETLELLHSPDGKLMERLSVSTDPVAAEVVRQAKELRARAEERRERKAARGASKGRP